MEEKSFGFRFLSGNVLKIIAAICMTIDHIGYIFFPDLVVFRIVGRIAFPIFAYMIAEGCKYTKNKLKYFLTIFILAIGFQIVYFIFENSFYMSVMVTFSIAILLVYALQYFKYECMATNRKIYKILLALLVFLALIVGVFILNIYVKIDYGFFGCILPLLVSLFHYDGNNKLLKSLDNHLTHVTMFFIGLILLSLFSGNSVQIFCILSVLLVLMYSGKRGKYNMKYFFYIFYPAHLVVLYLIRLIV